MLYVSFFINYDVLQYCDTKVYVFQLNFIEESVKKCYNFLYSQNLTMTL